MHDIWFFCYDEITGEVHPIARVDVGSGVEGEFLSNYLAENGRRIPILVQISIDGSVEILGTPKISVDQFLLRIYWLPMIPQVGETVVPPIGTGLFPAHGDLTATFLSCGVVPSLPVLLTCPGVWRMCALLHTAALASVMISFGVGVVRA